MFGYIIINKPEIKFREFDVYRSYYCGFCRELKHRYGAQGQATEIQITAKHILQTKEKINKILAERTGQDYEVIAADTERDNWKTAEEALEYGLIDAVITSRVDAESDK